MAQEVSFLNCHWCVQGEDLEGELLPLQGCGDCLCAYQVSPLAWGKRHGVGSKRCILNGLQPLSGTVPNRA